MHETTGVVGLNWTIIANALNFLILLFFIRKLLFKPLMAVVDKRREMIDRDLSEAAKSKDKASELAKNYEAKINAAESDAHEIIARAEKQANERREEIIAAAQAEAEQMKERAMREIDLAKRQALTQVRDQVSDISMLVASKFLQESVDTKLHKRLVDDFIGQLDQDKLGDAQC